jgi:hypothetical protein
VHFQHGRGFQRGTVSNKVIRDSQELPQQLIVDNLGCEQGGGRCAHVTTSYW